LLVLKLIIATVDAKSAEKEIIIGAITSLKHKSLLYKITIIDNKNNIIEIKIKKV
jgi:hypothetical protein